MSETPLMSKTLQQYPKQSIISELHELTFQSRFGSLRATICSWSLIYICIPISYGSLYLESIHLEDSNLIYNQNNNRGFTKILTAISLKTQHPPLFVVFVFFFLQPFLKTNSTNQDNTKQPQTLALGTRSKTQEPWKSI